MKKNKHEWAPFNDNQMKFRKELYDLSSTKGKIAYENRVYKGSNFFGFIRRQEKMNERMNNKKNKKRARKNRDY